MVPDPLADLARLDGVPSALAATRDAVDLHRRRRGLRPLPAAVLARARQVGSDASAELTGDLDRWRLGSAALAAELEPLSRQITVSPLQAIARAHVVVGSGQLADEERGRIRPDAEVAQRMHGLADLLTGPTRAPGLVLAAIAHAELATLQPFGTADDLVARSVERMLLRSSGVDPTGAVPAEAGHLALRSEYRRGLAGYATGTVVGVRTWLLHCAAALQLAAGRLAALESS